jgi:hypothetical protein
MPGAAGEADLAEERLRPLPRRGVRRAEHPRRQQHVAERVQLGDKMEGLEHQT